MSDSGGGLTQRFVLIRGEPVRERDDEAWVRWYLGADLTIARTPIRSSGEVVAVVTTSFLAIDHATAEGELVLFVSAVTGGRLHGMVLRSATKAGALASHARLVAACDDPGVGPGRGR